MCCSPSLKKPPNSPSSQTRQDYCNEWECERLNFMAMRTTWFFYDRGRLFGKKFQVRENPSGSVRKGCFQSKSQATNLFIRVICGWNIWNVSRIVKLSRSLSTITLKSTELNWRRYSIICMYRKQKPDQKTLWFDAETSNF